MNWTSADVARAIDVLGTSDSVGEAAGRLGVSEAALRSAFKRARKRGVVTGSPLNHVGAGRVVKAPSVAKGVAADGAGARVQKIMVCPDAHHPYVDDLAWRTFLEACRVVKPDALVIIGDFCDFLSVSAHPKSPADKIDFQAELAAANVALDQISALKIPRVVACEGNHETRITRYIAARAPELYGMMHVKDLLKIEKRGWEWVPYNSWLRIGEVAFTHDVGRSGVNTARQSLQDFGDNLVIGHSHRGAVVYQGTVEGRQHVCMNVGWLGSYEAVPYMHQARAKRDWCHGLGYIEQTKDGVSWCNFVPIISGRCTINGQVISGRAA